ncbi:MAG: GntR family transcriptional regulator [Lachnospiraceae bacterium]|nr:GntR family transcriptional regulator [Lachnospiraceae bacterium]
MKTLKQKIYETLKKEISGGVYSPGTQMHEQELAERFQSSRSPVRETLRQLVSDGLLVEFPNRGVFVKKYTAKDIEDIFDLRTLLENYAIRHIDNVSPENLRILNRALEDLEACHKAGNLEDYIAEDAKLHHKIVSMSKNNLVISTYERTADMMQQFRIYSLKSLQRFHESVDEHTQIIRALLDDDREEAVRINSKHLLLAKEAIITYLNEKYPENK